MMAGVIALILPFDFYFYGTNERNNWYMHDNGRMSQRTSSEFNNTWDRFVDNSYFDKLICPLWIDLMIDRAYIDDGGIYRDDLTNPDRVVFSWNCCRFGRTDDIYYFQSVLYPSGDIAHRYRYLSPRGLLVDDSGYDNPVNTENTVGISNSDGVRWMTNTPLNIGIANSPTAFYQCMDAFRGNYTVGAISGGAGQQTAAHFESMIFDSRTSKPDWQRLEYIDIGGAGQLRYSVRTGPTSLPELGGWSGWTVIGTSGGGTGNFAIPSPDERFLQYKVEFQRNNNGALPVLEEVRLVYGGISIDEIIANNPSGVSQGQTGIPVQATVRNFYSAPVNLTDIDLTFDLGSYTTTLVSPALPASIPADGTITVDFVVDVWDDSPVGTATIHAVATATVGALTFFDEEAQYPYEWWVRKKAEITLKQVETVPTHVNKGQNGIPINLTIENTGETPFSLDLASLTFSLGDYNQTLLSPPIGTVISGGQTIMATFTVNVLPTSPSGVAVIGASASGNNTFSGKITQDSTADITDSWTIQNPAQLVLEEVIASSSVYRGQTNTPVLLTVSNPGEAIGNWTSSDLLSHFTLGTYDAVYPVDAFPIQIPGGLQTTARYGVDISPTSATGTSIVDADITGTDNNTLFPIAYPGANLPASWTILAEKVSTYKDATFFNLSDSFNRPTAGTINIYAKGENLLPYGEFTFRWLNPSGVEVLVSSPLTANASGTLFHQFPVDNMSPYGDYKVKITNPIGTVMACENIFEVVSPAVLDISMIMPSTVSVGQPFIASLTFINSGGAAIDSGYPSSLDYFGPGTVNPVAGPNPAVLNVDGNSQATMTWNFVAQTPGNFSASATAYGFDANSNKFLTSPSRTSNVCLIQDPPDVAIQSVSAVPTQVYLNQKNLQITIRARNNGQATAMVDVASVSFTLGTYNQTLTSPSLPFALNGGATQDFVYDISVAPNSATGLSNFSADFQYYDNNWPASTTVINALTPNDSWTINAVGIRLSAESDFDPVQDNFNRNQTVFIRAYGLPPGSQWYRIRIYDSKIAQAGTVPNGWDNVSPPLAADADGYVDYLRTLPPTADIGDWSITIEPDADTNSGSREAMMGLQYFKVQNPGNLAADMAITPLTVFLGETFTVSMVATNTVINGSIIASAFPEALKLDTGAVGNATLVSGPTPVYVDVEAQTGKKFEWTYEAIQDTGIAGRYRLTSDAANSVEGRDLNTNATVTSNLAVSNDLIIYRRAMDLSSATLDFGTILCGEATLENTGVANIGNYPLDDVRWITTDLNGTGTLKIGKSNLKMSPSPVGAIPAGVIVSASASLFVPYNQPASTYIATMSLFNDRDGDSSFDIDEVYDLFTVKLVVPPCKRIFVVEKVIDLGGWSVGQTTNIKSLNAFSGGNLDLDNLKFKQTNGTNTFPINLNPINPGPLNKLGFLVASVSADITAGPNGNYIATWTIWNDEDNDDVIDGGEANDTFMVKVQVGGKSFSILPDPVDAGIGTPSTVITGFGPTITNTGMLNLSNLKAVYSVFSDGGGNTIGSDSIGITPPLTMPIKPGDSVPVPLSFFVPAGTPSATYTGNVTIYDDDNLNGSLDPAEVSASFDVKVFVPLVRLVQVLMATVDVGGLAPGTSRKVSFPCRNIGNVTLTNLRWDKTNLLDGGNDIPAGQVTFPPVEPFTVPAGDFFNHDIQISAPVAQPYGNYTSQAPFYWVYEDYNPTDIARSADEPDSNFIVACQIGDQNLNILEATLANNGIPNSTTSAITFNVRNTGSLMLYYPKATATALIPSVAGPANIEAPQNIFNPPSLGATVSGQTRQSEWRVDIPPNASAGVYLGTFTVWEDSNNNNIIDGAEAKDTAVLEITVDSAKVIEITQNPLDMGWASENMSKDAVFEVKNVGNVALDSVEFSPADLVFGFANIPAANIAFTPAILGPLAIAEAASVTVTVTIGAPQADGNYSGIQTVYDDYNPANNTHDGAAEESGTFEMVLKIGRKGLYEQTPANPDVAFGARDPGAVLTQGFTVYNSTAIPLSAVKCKVISTLYKGSYSIATSCLSLTPGTPLAISGGNNLPCQLNINCAANVEPGAYVGRICLWEDDGGTSDVIDPGEASATFNVTLNVNNYEALDIIEANYDFGPVTQGEWATKTIGIKNVGNVDITGFSWSFSDLLSGGFTVAAADFYDPGVSTHDPLEPNKIASYNVSVYISETQEAGIYGPNGSQQLTGGSVNDSCTFSLEVLEASTNGTNLASGTIEQEIATDSFPVVPAPPETYVLSAWVCPGTGTASIGFVQTKKESGKPVTISTYSLTLNANGNLASSGGLTDSGIIEKVPFKHPDFPLSFYFYRIYMTFDYCFDSTVASNTHIFLQNKATGAGDKTAVWFDGIQLEKSLSPNFTKPTNYHPFEKLVSPTRDKTLEGIRRYYEW